MIVKCISLPGSGEQIVDSSPWLKVGREYIVLSIEENSQGDRYYAIEPHSGNLDSFGFFPSFAFEVIDENWPEAWVEDSSGGEISIAPKAWQRAGFWEEFHDGEKHAVDTYREDRDRILQKAV